ncbi:MAG TPA: hypothetical protein DEP84_07975 [Chloroflexi bacterium]|nr:hypothetical protein [Chloroflexota bacterium]
MAGSPTPTRTPTATSVAADLFVDDDNSTGNENGTAQYPYNTIQEAINAAGSGETIAVAAGTYAENIRVQDKAVHLSGGYVGGTASDYAGGSGGNFNARNPTANATHIQGDGTDSTVTLLNAGTSTVDGFRITGGSRSVEGLPWYNLGGGFYVSGGAPTIAHNVIEDNDTRTAAAPGEETVGGGIYASDSDVSILDSLIRNNTSGRGAGIAIDGGTVVIRGNTVQGNVGVSDHGGGLYIASPAATIAHNRIMGNEVGRPLGYGWGGGIIVFGVGSAATLSSNTITDNYAPSMGSGVFIDDGADATLDHELIYRNRCTESGGVGIYVDGAGEGAPGDPGSRATVLHSTIAGHDCETWPGGNGLMVERNSRVTVKNSIFWGQGGDDFWVDATSTISVTYTTSQEAIPGPGNRTSDPLFADAGNGDYHLRSIAGRWDPSANGGSGGWVMDAGHSPAIDAGDPASDYASEPSPNGGRVNMGVYGNTAQASKSSQIID